MKTITTIGFDIAKSVFQVHGVDAAGEVVIRRQLKRRHVRPHGCTDQTCIREDFSCQPGAVHTWHEAAVRGQRTSRN